MHSFVISSRDSYVLLHLTLPYFQKLDHFEILRL